MSEKQPKWNGVQENARFIHRRVLRQDIKSYLQEAILNGELEPGKRIVETKIAKELGVSQAPVREAIRELELMGLIESKPFQGAFVKKLSRQDISDAYQVRAYLEGLAAREAVPKISAEQLQHMEELVQQMNKAARLKKMKEFVELDIAFHGLILDIAGNKLLKKMWKMVHLGQWTFITTSISKRSLPELAQRHELILDSFKNKDAKQAEAQMQQHIQDLLEEVLQNFSESW
ncbi:MAG TPA: GntR family transcriptional regulator [Bacillota bacterium]|nr:GntR family transcriptional regulator [Bacillota bacterium]